jgi:hypothetical protein
MSSVVIAGNTSGTVTLNAPDVAGTTTLTLPTTNGTLVTTASGQALTSPTITGTATLNGVNMTPYTMKNRIINGTMVIDQRNAGASLTPTTDGQYTLDRFQVYISQSSKFSVQQNAGSVTPPAGFNYYAGITSLSAYTVGSSDYFCFVQNIEGYNIGDFAWGTASAKTITISFWVRSSLTGTFGGSIRNGAANYSYPFTYSISSANTWEQKTVTIAGPTSGTWTTVNTSGLQLILGLGVGSTNSGTAGAWTGSSVLSATSATSVVGTNGATFYVTGVQLEVGSVASAFEWRPFTTELQLCQRYFYKTFNQSTAVANNTAYQGGIGVPGGLAFQTGAMRNFTIFPQPMRTIPTVTYYNTDITTPRTNNVWLVYLAGGAGWVTATATTSGEVSELYVEPNIDKSGSFTIGYSYLLSGFLTASAEL